MGSSEILANWVAVGDRMYQRTEIYGAGSWSSAIYGGAGAPDVIVPAPFGGPILAVRTSVGIVGIHRASGPEIGHFRWRNSTMVGCGWSHLEEAVFVVEDGTILTFNVFGDFLKSTSMGQEAKDLRIRDARIFRGGESGAETTGVAVLTNSNRFFVINNIYKARIWKMVDLPNTFYSMDKFPWVVSASNPRSSRILIASSGPDFLTILSQSDASSPEVHPDQVETNAKVITMSLGIDGESLAVFYDTSVLWLGKVIKDKAIRSARISLRDEEGSGFKPEEIVWCGSDSVVVLSPSTAQAMIVSADGSGREVIYLPGHLGSVEDIDGVRILTNFSHEFIQLVPRAVQNVFAIGSMSAGKKLLLAAEEFDRGSHRANEYIKSLGNSLDLAISECIESAGLVMDPVVQKELARAAQFGKSFLKLGSKASADDFSNVCKTLRVLNALKLVKVGLPLTIGQFKTLTPPVVIDRLLTRRMYPLAAEICTWLGIPAQKGANRVLAHWACYKVAKESDEGADEVAKVIHGKLGNQPQISYCDIAAKAADHGKKDLAIKLLEYEAVVSRQVPLLVSLGQHTQALTRALKSGDQNLAYSVIVGLRKTLPSTEFHMLIRKYALGRTLYENYCRGHDDHDALQDWHLQEDNFSSQAVSSFEKAVAAERPDTRMAQLINVQELFQRAVKQQPSAPGLLNDSCPGLVEENHKLLKTQTMLEDKLPGKVFVGMSLHQTLSALIQQDETKWAEKVRSDFKVSERRFTWLKLKKQAESGQWEEIRKFALKQKKKPIIPTSGIVSLVKQYGGASAAKPFEEILAEEDK